MDKPAEWREMLLQYRLDELDETQREEVDALLITDPEFSAAMQEAEYDLLDAYAARELSERDMLRVERALQPAGRFSPEAPGRVIRSPASPRAVVRSKPVPSRRWMYLLAIAAVLLVAVVVSATRWRSHPAPEQTIARSAQPAPQPSTASQPQPAATVTGNKPVSPSTVATVLLPGALRSQGALSLTIAGDVKTIRFVLPPSPDQPVAAAYQLQVVGDDGQPVCRSTRPTRDRRPLSFTCPAASLPSGASFVRVVALPSTPDAAPLLELALSVSRK
jgi:hypothetical protein